jgi:hypothetical protein
MALVAVIVNHEVDLFQVYLTAARHPSARIYRRHFGLAYQIPVGSASRECQASASVNQLTPSLTSPDESAIRCRALAFKCRRFDVHRKCVAGGIAVGIRTGLCFCRAALFPRVPSSAPIASSMSERSRERLKLRKADCSASVRRAGMALRYGGCRDLGRLVLVLWLVITFARIMLGRFPMIVGHGVSFQIERAMANPIAKMAIAAPDRNTNNPNAIA